MIVHLPASAVPGPLVMWTTEGRDGASVSAPVSALGDGAWAVDTTGMVGRYWPTINYTIDTDPHSLNLPYVDLPEDPTLIVSPESVGKKAGLTLPLTEAQRETIVDAILDAQADVSAYLGRAIVPTVYTETGRYDDGTGRWNITPLDEPLIEVIDATPETSQGEPTGFFTVVYRAGLNAKDDPDLRPIRRYVTAAAMNAPEFIMLWRTATGAKGEIKSVTTEGQSITWDKATLGGGGKGQPGELPGKNSLDRWRIAGRRAFQRRTVAQPPWPYSGISSHGSHW